MGTPNIENSQFVTTDGLRLPIRNWKTEDASPEAIVIAVHGFNDYSLFFEEAGLFLARQGIASFAYDQRGFGETPDRGLWPGYQAYASDLAEFSRLVRRRYPDTPLYLLGESMGGAIVMVATTNTKNLPVDGVILSAPAVWGRRTMPWYQRLALWIGVKVAPWKTLTGEGLKIMPSDNIKMLTAWSQDPLVIKATRIDTMYGLTNLMDKALDNSQGLEGPYLIMYGEKDQVIPKEPTREMFKRLPDKCDACRIAVYQDGYHMLMRDLQAEVPLGDIVHWIKNPMDRLPSGAEDRAGNF